MVTTVQVIDRATGKVTKELTAATAVAEIQAIYAGMTHDQVLAELDQGTEFAVPGFIYTTRRTPTT